MSDALWLPAPAKVNLGLRVLRRRPDGYHELDTVFHALALSDDLVAQRSDEPGVSLVMSDDGVDRGLEVAGGADNLVVRAALAVLGSSGSEQGLRFWLRKRIPAGGGLGGGSSDAAAALRLSDALLGTGLSEQRLAALALGLGADVPFFLMGGTARGRGVGEQLQTLSPAPHLHFVLIIPPFGTPTPEVFGILATGLIGSADRTRLGAVDGPAELRVGEVPMASEIAMIAAYGNELEEAAMRCRPALADLREQVRAVGATDVRLSGSGSTMFVARPSSEEADALLSELRRSLPGDVGLVRTESAAPAGALREASWRTGSEPVVAD